MPELTFPGIFSWSSHKKAGGLCLLQGLSENSDQLQQNFAELAESVQHEKQQFYQLTADTINKTDVMRSQFAKQVSKD